VAEHISPNKVFVALGEGRARRRCALALLRQATWGCVRGDSRVLRQEQKSSECENLSAFLLPAQARRLLACAVAKSDRTPLLFKGEDFGQPDVRFASARH